MAARIFTRITSYRIARSSLLLRKVPRVRGTTPSDDTSSQVYPHLFEGKNHQSF